MTDITSYATLAEANAYHAARLNADWSAATEAARNAALLRATDYIDATYHALSAPDDAAQALQWPTQADEGLPAKLVAATILLALEGLTGALLAPAPARGVKSVKKALEGVGSTETVFDDLAVGDPFPAITAMLAGIARPVGGNGLVIGRLNAWA